MRAAKKPDFADAVRKVERANHHIDAFARAAAAHFAKHPTSVSMLPIKKLLAHGFFVGDRMGFPDKALALYVGDAVHNLRCALDYLITACAKANGGREDRTEFPIVKAGGKKDDLAKGLWKLKDAGPLAIELVKRVRPYPRGNPHLVAVGELDLFDKHRLILAVQSSVDISVRTGGWNNLPMDTIRSVRRNGRGSFMPVNPGYEEALAVDMEFSAEILFAPRGPLARKPCHASLRMLSGAVADVIATFEEAFRTPGFARSLPRVT